MTKRAIHRVRSVESVVALCVVLLQLLGSLHFALIPHRFGAGLGGFVHLRGGLVAEPERASAGYATRSAPERPTLVARNASCEPEACPLGFSGPVSRPVVASELSQLIWLPAPDQRRDSKDIAVSRVQCLLSAPKTSPPLLG
jgi:hypothetical protein